LTEVVIISGKGGTGKTSLAASLAALYHRPILVDGDVDAANLHLLLAPDVRATHDFYGGAKASIDPGLCTDCGTCAVLCRFEAVRRSAAGTRSIDAPSCEGCAVCARFCPNQAISLKPQLCGQWFRSETRFGPLLHARLFPAQENSGKLVSLLRREARKLFREAVAGMLLVDGPPGVGYPAIASLTGADYAVIVTESTVSGIEDLRRAAELGGHFHIPVGVVINKADLNPRVGQQIRDYAANSSFDLLGELPYDTRVTRAQMLGRTIVEGCGGDLVAAVGSIAENLRQAVGRARPALAITRES
jgi:MinD superfamily P-loop ATPase